MSAPMTPPARPTVGDGAAPGAMAPAPDRWAWRHEVMGTVASTHIIPDPAVAPTPGMADVLSHAVERAIAHLREVEAVFSPYLADSAVSRIASGRLPLQDADPRVQEVAQRCREAEVATGGRFSAYWSGHFDPTGYVKGWAVAEAARRHLAGLVDLPGVRAVGLSAGGDMQLVTDPCSDWRWRIGLADPRGGLLGRIEVRDGAVATSGTGERGHHIRDPRTGEVAGGAVSATVVAADLAIADIWATSAIVAGADGIGWLDEARPRGVREVIVLDEQRELHRWTPPGLAS